MDWKLNSTPIGPQKEISNPTKSQDTFPIVDNMQKKMRWVFFATMVCVVVVVVFLLGVVVGVVMVVWIVPFLNMSLALDDQ